MDKTRLDQFSDPVVNIYLNMEQDITEGIAKDLGGRFDLLETDPAAWKLQQMQNLGIMDKRNLETIRKQAGLTKRELNGLLYGAGLEGLSESESDIQSAVGKGAALVVPAPIHKSPQIFNILKAYEAQAVDKLNLTNQALIKASKQKHIDIINKVTAQTLAGVKSGEQAMRESIRSLADDGITIVKNKAGHKVSTEGYVRSVVRSTANNTVNEMQDQRFKEWGVKFCEVSSHAGNRPGCVPYAGRIFSLDPEEKSYPYLYDSSIGRIGAADSLFGVNCGHVKYPFFPGISNQRYTPNPPAQNKKVYKESQQQRKYERDIRKAKHQKRMFEANGDLKGAAQATQLIKARQLRMRNFIGTSGRTRRGSREQIGGGNGPGSIPKPVVDIPIPPNLKTKVISPPVTKAIKEAPKPKTIPAPPVAVIDPKDANVGSIVGVEIRGEMQEAMLMGRSGTFADVELRDGTIKKVPAKNIKEVRMQADAPNAKVAPPKPVDKPVAKPVKKEPEVPKPLPPKPKPKPVNKPEPKDKPPVKKNDGDDLSDAKVGTIVRVEIDGKLEDAMVIEKGSDFIKVDRRDGSVKTIKLDSKSEPPTKATAKVKPVTRKPMEEPETFESFQEIKRVMPKKDVDKIMASANSEEFNDNAEKLLKSMAKKSGMDKLKISMYDQAKLDSYGADGLASMLVYGRGANAKWVAKELNFGFTNKSRVRSNAYNFRVVLHEFYHAKRNGGSAKAYMDANKLGPSAVEEFSKMEEVFTELSAHKMMKSLGVNDTTEFAYANFLIDTLPNLKNTTMFRSANSLDEMQDIMVASRFGKNASSDFSGLIKEIKAMDKIDKKKYTIKYRPYIEKNIDAISDDVALRIHGGTGKDIAEGKANIKRVLLRQFGRGETVAANNPIVEQAILSAMSRGGIL